MYSPCFPALYTAGVSYARRLDRPHGLSVKKKTGRFTAAEFCSDVLLFLQLSICDNVISVSRVTVSETSKVAAKERNFP